MKSRSRVLPVAALVLPLVISLLLPSAAVADVDIGASLSYRFLGEFGVPDQSDEYKVDEDFGFNLTIDVGVGNQNQVEFLWSRVDSKIAPKKFDEVDYGVTIDYVHVGYLHYYNWREYQTFLVTSGGVTMFSPDFGTFEDSTVPSLGFGGGIKIPLIPILGIRVDGRGYVSFVDEGSGVICSERIDFPIEDGARNGCYMEHKSSTFIQIEATAGVYLNF